MGIGQGQVFIRKLAHVGQVLLRVRPRPGREVAQKLDHVQRRLRHLGRQRKFSEIVVTQQLRFFLAQRQHFAYEIRVVKLSQVSAGLIRRTRHIGPVKGVAQGGVVRELHDRQITGHLEAELVAFNFLRLCRQQSGVAHVFGYTVEFGRAGVVSKLVGGVECVFAEFLAQFGLALLNRGKPFTGCALQFRAAQHEVAQRVFVCLALFGIERRRVDCLVFGI